MSHPFHAYGAALGLVSALRPVLGQLAKADRALADQLRRAAASVVLNLAEGNRRMGKDRIHLFRVAAGSAAEVKAALEVTLAWGMVGSAAEVDRELDRVLAMLWLGLPPSGLRPGRASHAALFAGGKWWRLTHPRRP